MNEPDKRSAVIYVDVDDTLVRHASSVPVPKTFHPQSIDDESVDAVLP